ncbi:MAG: hypothetical protein HKN64_00830 [Woeseiaceae bacterium]|nr:hypothetical protein [Woeseiaceae bacterium]
MTNNNFGYACLPAGAAMLALSFLCRHFAALLLALALLGFAAAFLVHRARSAGLAAGATFTAIAAAEFVMAFFLPAELAPERSARFDASSDYAKQYFTQATDLGPLANPGVHSSRKQASDGELIYDVQYSIGADGFRITPGGSANPAKATRINFFGGSFTFGEGLHDDETLPYFVATGWQDIAVKNYGFHGYGPHQALAILQGERDTQGEINFFMTSPWHAQRAACVPAYSSGSPRFVLTDDKRVVRDGVCQAEQVDISPLKAAAGRVLAHSNLYRALRVLTPKGSQEKEMDLYLAIVAEMARLSRNRGQRFIVGYVKADDNYLSGAYSNDTIYEALARVADDVIDLTLAESDAALTEEYFIHELDRHPSALANQKRAQLLSQRLELAPIPVPVLTY